jgi:hypothetical protein
MLEIIFFMPAGRAEPVFAEYVEHVPPDVTAGIFWLKNRDPERWRDVQNVTHELGKYIISDTPMTDFWTSLSRSFVVWMFSKVAAGSSQDCADQTHGSAAVVVEVET